MSSAASPETVSVSRPVAAMVPPALRQRRHRLRPRGGAQRDPVTGRGRDQRRHGGVGDDLAAAGHHKVVRGVLQLGHQVAGHQHRAALAGQRPQEPAHPHDALGVHAVERLVEHEHRRVAEQRRGDAEPLPHAQRVAAGLAPGGLLQAGLLDHLVDPPGAQALGVGQPQQVVAGACGWAAGRRRPAATRRGSAGAAGSGSAARRSARCRRRGRPGRGSPASWWTCPRRSGRRTR